MTTHGLRKTSTYGRWHAMKNRCLNPNATSFDRYGGRGITVCERWMSFQNFVDDMGIAPEGKTLERRDNNKGYDKSNCYWATPVEQSRNRRSNRSITAFGKTQLLVDWSKETGIPMNIITGRIDNSGWDVEVALTDHTRHYGNAKLSPISVRRIKKLLKSKTADCMKTAKTFGVSRAAIYKIKSGENWK